MRTSKWMCGPVERPVLPSWAMISATGGQAVERATAEGPEMFFNLASDRIGSTALHLGHALFLTSLIAAMISFHNIIARYAFSLGRAGHYLLSNL